MRIAIVSDIHGNRTAFDAVLKDLRETAPDLILHGGDLADMGASPAEIVDRIRDLGWNGVLGNTDEMHARPESLEEFAKPISGPTAAMGGPSRDGCSDSDHVGRQGRVDAHASPCFNSGIRGLGPRES